MFQRLHQITKNQMALQLSNHMTIESFLDPLPIRSIPGIGKKSEEKFSEMNLQTISQLRSVDVFTLNGLFGRKIGSYIYNAAHGIDEEPVSPRHDPIQYSRIVTLKQDSKDFDFLVKDLEKLCVDLHETIVKDNYFSNQLAYNLSSLTYPIEQNQRH